MHNAPTLLMIQPMIALGPSGASATGSMKMPAPIIVPTTSALVIQMPILWSDALPMAPGPTKCHAWQSAT